MTPGFSACKWLLVDDRCYEVWVLYTLSAIFVLCAALTIVLIVIHRTARFHRNVETRTSSALESLEAKGGRHRLGAQVAEISLLVALVWIGLGGVISMAGRASGQDGWLLAPLLCSGALVAWWLYRRGALRAVRRSGNRDG